MPRKQSDDLTRKGDKKQQTDEGLTIPVPEREDRADGQARHSRSSRL